MNAQAKDLRMQIEVQAIIGIMLMLYCHADFIEIM